MVCRLGYLCVLFLGWSYPVWAQGEGQNKPFELLKSNGELMWTADPNHVVTAGLAQTTEMDLPSALAVIRQLNLVDSDNFGFGDWRLPSPWELAMMLSQTKTAAAEAPEIKRWLDTLSRQERFGATGQTGKDDTKPSGSAEATLVYVWPIRGAGVMVGFDQVAVFATNSIHLKQGATVHSGSVVVNETSPGPTLAGNVDLMVANGVTTSAGYFIAANSVSVKNQAEIGGDVYANELQNQGNILGTVSPYAPPIFSLLPPFETTPQVGGNPPEEVTVAEGDSISLDAGSYAILQAGEHASVHFTGGEYDFTEFSADDRTSLTFAAPSVIRIAGKLVIGQNSYTGPADGSSIGAADIVFYVDGINGDTGELGDSPPAAEIYPKSDFLANLYVPNGTLRLRQKSMFTGAFLGRDVIVEPKASVVLASAFVNQAPEAGDDEIVVEAGATANVLVSGETSLLANDSDPDGNNLSVTTTPLSGPLHGTLVLQSDGTFSYTHDGSATTSDSFLYEVCDDGIPQECAIGQVSIEILAETITVTVSTAGEGSGFVSSDPEGLGCRDVCAAPFLTTSAIFLTADADPGSVFTGWGGDPDCFDGVLSPNTDKNCIANFGLAEPPPTETVVVTVSKAGDGSGLVLSDPGGIFCGSDCQETYPLNTRIELTAIADSGSIFTGWSGDPDCITGRLSGQEDVDCIANFEAEPPPPEGYDLHVIITGGGEAAVATNPSGLNCSDDCTATYPMGTQLNLLIRPAPGTIFIGWSGDCSGNAFITPLLMDSDKTCTATVVQP